MIRRPHHSYVFQQCTDAHSLDKEWGKLWAHLSDCASEHEWVRVLES